MRYLDRSEGRWKRESRESKVTCRVLDGGGGLRRGGAIGRDRECKEERVGVEAQSSDWEMESLQASLGGGGCGAHLLC